jgi:Right handed beta helix region
MTRTRWLRILVPALALVALALPASASGQATRTWVSGVGDDVNPCSRTAPCKTFAGAISKTAAGGIIMTMDDGGFGALTITKPITVDGGHHQSGMLASGGINAINVNINPLTQPANYVNNGRVVLKNLKMEGNTLIPSAGGFTPGLNGVRITNAKSVKIVNSDIGFFSRSGVAVEPATETPLIKVAVINSHIHDNGGAGVLVSPPTTSTARVSVRRNSLDDNGCGLVANRFGMAPTFDFSTACATASTGGTATSVINAFDNDIADSQFRGIFSRAATVRIGRNTVTGTIGGPALGVLSAGVIESFGDNLVTGNPGGDGAPTGPLTPARVKSP